MKRGYCGIAFWQPKEEKNIGTVFRNAHCFDADFVCIIGDRAGYNESSNTTRAERHIPVFKYADIEDFMAHVPVGCEVVSVEVDGEDIAEFRHPERAIYLFGGEDRTLPDIGGKRVRFDTLYCLNMATSSGIVLFDRQSKSNRKPA